MMDQKVVLTEQESSHIHKVVNNIEANKSDLSDALASELQVLAFDNRYMLHPTRLREIAPEQIQSLIHFIKSREKERAIQYGASLATEGLAIGALFITGRIFLNHFLNQMVGNQKQVMQTGIKLLQSYISSCAVGYIQSDQKTIMKDQEQLRKALSTALQRQRRELLFKNQAIHTSLNGILLTDTDGYITYANPAFLEMWGYDNVEEVLGNHCGRFLKNGEFKDIWSSLKNTEGWQQEFTAVRHDATSFAVTISASLIRNEENEPLGIMMYFIDVTERKRLEDQLRHSQKLEAIGSLAGGVAHDFNNILGVIVGYSSLLLEKYNGQLESVENGLKRILQAGEQGEILTKKLLAFSRKQILQPKVLNINTLIDSIESMLQRLISVEIEIISDLTKDPAYVNVDPGEMEQVLLNLAINAKDAMPDGGKFIIKTDFATLRSHSELEPGEYVLLSVSDSGVGMDAETQSKIFEPFFTTKEMGKGTGLGLSTVYGIIKQCQGHISVYSEPEQGTTFKIYLPKVTGNSQDEQSEHEGTHSGEELDEALRGNETILVVEDNKAVRDLVTSMLIEYGYRVLVASYGPEAIKIAQQELPDIHLLLTDIIMPGMNGFEVSDQLKNLQSDLKVIYMSGYSEKLVSQHGVLDKGSTFIQKPFETLDLVQTIRDRLDAD